MSNYENKVVTYVEPAERGVGHLLGDPPLRLHLGEVAHAPEQAVGDARRPARAARDFEGS